MFQFISKLNKTARIILLSVLIVVVIAGAYAAVKYLFKKEIKKELLVSIAVTPNDTSETTLSYKNEISLKIPRGGITNPDTLDIYDVQNIEKPEFADGLAKTYDLNFRKTEKFSNGVELEISYADLGGDLQNENDKNIYIMYYDEKEKQWHEVNSETDRVNKKLILFTDHFSSYGVVYSINNPHPLMKLHERKSNLELQSLPDIQKSQQILEGYSNTGNPTTEGIKSGYQMFEEAFNLTTQFTSLAQELTGTAIFETLNKFAGEFGLLQSFRQFAIEIYEGKYEQAKLNLCKNLMMYSLGKWGSQALRIANIGIFLIDYSLTKFGTRLYEITEKKHQEGYDKYNQHNNNFRLDKEGWKKFILDRVSEKADLKAAVDSRLNSYLHDYFYYEGIKCPKNIEEMLVSKERARILEIFHAAVKEASKEINEQRKMEIINKIAEMKDLLNEEFPISVYVNGDESEINGLPVKIVVGRDQQLWEGKTDHAYWTCKCTWLGYLFYKKPNTVELEYDGKILKQNFTPTRTGAQVTFNLPKKETGDCDVPKGKYKGKINVKNVREGTVEIVVIDNENITFDAKLTKHSSYDVYKVFEEQTIKANGKAMIFNSQCVIQFEGIQNFKSTQTDTRDGKVRDNTTENKWIMLAIHLGNKIVQHPDIQPPSVFTFEATKTD